jgi:hypothetical protein
LATVCQSGNKTELLAVGIEVCGSNIILIIFLKIRNVFKPICIVVVVVLVVVVVVVVVGGEKNFFECAVYRADLGCNKI